MPVKFRKLVPVHVNAEDAEGPELAVIELDEKQIKRIRQLATAVKTLKVSSIEDCDYPTALKTSEYEIPGTGWRQDDTGVTDKTTLEEAALLINDDNPFISVLAKQRLAGHDVTSQETFEALCTVLPEWDGRSECERIRVTTDDVHYCGLLKNTSVEWETEGIPLKELPRVK